MENFTLPLHPILVFVVVLARVGGLMTFAPFWSHNAATSKVRVILAGTLAVVLTPIIAARIETPPTEVYGLAIVLMGEVLIGMLMGFVGRIIFSGLEFAAHFTTAQMGFSLAGTIDPSSQAQTTAFGTIAQMVGLMTLLAADGHHWFLAAAVKSFSSTAPGSFSFSPQLLDIFLRLSANALVVGITLAAPAIIVLLAVEFSLEFFGRMAPQFQVFVLGFPLKISVGLWLIGGSIYFLPAAIRDVLSNIHHSLLQVLGAM